MSQVHNGNPESRFVYAALRARGVAIDADPKEAVKHFEYAERMGIGVPARYLERLRAQIENTEYSKLS
jgi:hypothetical protein